MYCISAQVHGLNAVMQYRIQHFDLFEERKIPDTKLDELFNTETLFKDTFVSFGLSWAFGFITKKCQNYPNFFPTFLSVDFDFNRYHSNQAERFPLKSGSLQGSTVLYAAIQYMKQNISKCNNETREVEKIHISR